MASNRTVNVCIWLSSLVLYAWIKQGGAEAELGRARGIAADVWHQVIGVEDCR